MLGYGKYEHAENIEQLLNNLLFDLKDKLTTQEIYNITTQYNRIKTRELIEKEQQQKELNKQLEIQIQEKIIKELEKLK